MTNPAAPLHLRQRICRFVRQTEHRTQALYLQHPASTCGSAVWSRNHEKQPVDEMHPAACRISCYAHPNLPELQLDPAAALPSA